MDFRDIGACSLDEIGLKGNHIMGPCRAGQISIPEDLVDAFGKGMALFGRKKAFVGIDDIGGFIDLPQPVEIISWRLGSNTEPVEIRAQRVRASTGFFMV